MEFEQQLSWPKKFFVQMTRDQLQCLVFLVVEHTNENADSKPIWWPANIQFYHPFIGETNSSYKQVKRELISIIKSFTAYNKDHEWFFEAFRFASRPKDDESGVSSDKSLHPIVNFNVTNVDTLLNNNNNVENKLSETMTQNNSMVPLVVALPVEPIKLNEIEKEITITHVSKRLLPTTTNNKQPTKKQKMDDESITLKLHILKKMLPSVTVNVYDVVKYGCPENKDDFLSTLNLMKSDVLDKLNGMHGRKLRNNSNLVRPSLPIGFDEEYKNKIALNSYIRNSPRMVSIVTNQVIPIFPLRHNNSTRLSFAKSTPTIPKAIAPGPFQDLNNETPFIISDSENDSIIISSADSSDSKENKCNSSNRRDSILQDRAAFSPLVCSDLNSDASPRKRKLYRRRLLKIDKIGKQSKTDLSLIQKQISNYFLPSSNLEDKYLGNKISLLKDQCRPCFVKLFPLRKPKQKPLMQRRKSIHIPHTFVHLISDDEDDTTEQTAHKTLSNSSIEFKEPPEIGATCSSSQTVSESPIELVTSKNGNKDCQSSEKEECVSSQSLPENHDEKRLSDSVFAIKKRNEISCLENKVVVKKSKKIPSLKIKWPAKRLNIIN